MAYPLCTSRSLGLVVLGSILATSLQAAPSPTSPTSSRPAALLADLPLTFEPNEGQFAGPVEFVARGAGSTLILFGNEVALRLHGRGSEPVIRMRTLGGRSSTHWTGVDPLPGKSNYLRGSDRSRWRVDVPQYGGVRCDAVYPGIDLVFHGNPNRLEYDFVVAPGTDPSRIRMVFDGAGVPKLRAGGELVLRTKVGELVQPPPFVYQKVHGELRPVAARYRLRRTRAGRTEVGFAVGAYDPAQPLVLDPVLTYSTYLGGRGEDTAPNAMAVDSAGNVYLVGTTSSPDFPGRSGHSAQSVFGSRTDAFVAKINAAGTALLYSTYLGGDESDYGYGIAVDPSGNIYVVGATYSVDFPAVGAASIQPRKAAGIDAFLVKLDPSGSSFRYSTYYGGESFDVASAVAADAAGHAYVIGDSASPSLPGIDVHSLQRSNSGFGTFVAKVEPEGTGFVYATFYGGTDPGDIAADSAGNAYLTGASFGPYLQGMTGRVFQSTPGGYGDAFVAKINPLGTGVVYSTFFGGARDDAATGIAVDEAGQAYLTGWSRSATLPGTDGPRIQGRNAEGIDAFVAKLDPAGEHLVYATFLGGDQEDRAQGIAVDRGGNAFVAGYTASRSLPGIRADSIQPNHGGSTFDAFVTEIDPLGKSILFSTFLGGNGNDRGFSVGVDGAGHVYVAGDTESASFPGTASTSIQPHIAAGQYDAFLTQITAAPPGSCVADATTLCLDDRLADHRFEVRLHYATAQGGGLSGEGRAVPLQALGVGRGGLFWFFESRNPEMLVKVLNGCAANGKLWVFASAGTNVGWTMDVRDTRTGAAKQYASADLASAPPVQDTAALDCSAEDLEVGAAERAAPSAAEIPPASGSAPCLADGATLCLAGRFQVRAYFSTEQNGGQAGAGHAVDLSGVGVDRGGLFWFFDPGNPEMLIKLVDGCAVNGKLWVYASAGTNVGLTVTVTDTTTGETATYRNSDLHPAEPIQDTTALSCAV